MLDSLPHHTRRDRRICSRSPSAQRSRQLKCCLPATSGQPRSLASATSTSTASMLRGARDAAAAAARACSRAAPRAVGGWEQQPPLCGGGAWPLLEQRDRHVRTLALSPWSGGLAGASASAASPSPCGGALQLAGAQLVTAAAAAAASGAPSPSSQPAPALLPQQLGGAYVAQLRDVLQLHNTMTRRKERFAPRPERGDALSMYVCGVTVYDYSHIGHARVYVAFDVLYRLLSRGLRYDVTYCRNFTDVDDKIIKRAAERGEEPLALASRFIDEFHADMAALNCLPPTLEPRATDHVADMVATIERIIANGHAYAVDGGDVYFDVASLEGYGRLSRRAGDDNRAGERVAVDGRKRGAADFALWKAAKPGEPSWDSPWGAGRPGWHIECSAMIGALLGPVVDLHGGGADLVFPHHENELAQSQAACGCGGGGGGGGGGNGNNGAAALHDGTDFVRHWVHNGFVNVESEKMSKSLGNFFTIRDAVARYHALSLRWFLLGTHYRAPINYTQRALEEASDRLYYVYQTLADVDAELLAAGAAGADAVAAAAADTAAGRGAGAETLRAALAALVDDLNAPLAVAELSAPLKAANDLLSTRAGRKNAARLPLLAQAREGVGGALALLGLDADGGGDGGGVTAVLSEMRALALVRAGLTEADVAALIEARTAARGAKDFAAADAVRLELAARGVMIMDSPAGTTWRPGVPQAAGAE